MLHSRRGNRGFRLHHRRQLVHAQAQLGQFFIIDLKIDFFRLHAQQVNLFYIRHLYEIVFDTAGYLTHLFVRKAVGRNRVHITEHIVKMIVKERSVHLGGQFAPFVIDPVTQIQPVAGNGFGRNTVLQIYVDNADARSGITGNIIQIVYGLYHFFNFIRNMHLHLLGSGARPGSGNDHLRQGEAGVFLTAQHRVTDDPHNRDHRSKEVDDLLVFD